MVAAADVALKTGTGVLAGQVVREVLGAPVVLIVDPGRAAAQADSLTNHRLGKGRDT